MEDVTSNVRARLERTDESCPLPRDPLRIRRENARASHSRESQHWRVAGLTMIAVALTVATLAPSGAEAAEGRVVALFDIEAEPGVNLPLDSLLMIRAYLEAQLTSTKTVRVVPRDALLRRLAPPNSSSLERCFSLLCQVTLGRAVSANNSVGIKLTKPAARCLIAATIYDTESATPEAVVSAEGSCTEGGVIEAAVILAKRIAVHLADRAGHGSERPNLSVPDLSGQHTPKRAGEIKPFSESRAIEGESAEQKEFIAVAGDMVDVPAGSFQFGCKSNTPGKQSCANRTPVREIYIAAFQIDRTEVTSASYASCLHAGTCASDDRSMEDRKDRPSWDSACNLGKAGRENHPMNCVTWREADRYCRSVGRRLPSEEEWEKAARGIDGRTYPWGEADWISAGGLANIGDDSLKRVSPLLSLEIGVNDGFAYSAPVGSFPAGKSPYGAMDMMGNVREWTDSTPMIQEGERGAGTIDKKRRVVRGGSWGDHPRWVDTYSRDASLLGTRGALLGFRCAR